MGTRMLRNVGCEVRSVPVEISHFAKYLRYILRESRCRRTPAARYVGLLKTPKERTTGSGGQWTTWPNAKQASPLRLPCEARIPLHGSLRLQTDWMALQPRLLRSLRSECAHAVFMKADPMGEGLGTNRNNLCASCHKNHQNGTSSSCRRTRWGT